MERGRQPRRGSFSVGSRPEHGFRIVPGGVGSWLSERSRDLQEGPEDAQALHVGWSAGVNLDGQSMVSEGQGPLVAGSPRGCGGVGWRALRQNLSSSLHEALARSSEVICVNSIPQENHALAREGHVGTLSSSRRSFLMPTVLMWRCHCNVFLLYCAFAADSCQPHFTRSLCS